MSISRIESPRPALRWCAFGCFLAALQACGGGGGGGESLSAGAPAPEPSSPAEQPSLPAAPPGLPAAPGVEQPPGVPAPAPTPAPAPAPASAPVVAPPVVAAPAVPSPAPPAATPAPPASNLVALTGATSCGIAGFREVLQSRINSARAAGRSCGGQAQPAAAALAWNDRLFSAAARHSVDMASRNYFSHTSPEGVDAAARATAAGYGWSAIGENIAAGDVTVDGVMATWMGSAGHCLNIMNPVFKDVAVACVARPGTTWGTYWTMVLAR